MHAKGQESTDKQTRSLDEIWKGEREKNKQKDDDGYFKKRMRLDGKEEQKCTKV